MNKNNLNKITTYNGVYDLIKILHLEERSMRNNNIIEGWVVGSHPWIGSNLDQLGLRFFGGER